MSNDPDLERDLERLISRIDLPDNERWVPSPVTRARKPAWAVAGAAAAVVIALAIGVASQSASDNTASRSPVISPPLLSSRPAPSPSPTGSVPPRGTAVVGPAGIILDFKEEGGAAADDHALGVVVHESSRIVVTEVGGQKHTFEATRGRLAFLAGHGALRGDLLTYIEVDYADLSSESSLRAVWHVMVANWRTGAITELDAIPSERATAPMSSIAYMPKVLTNGREVIWLRAPRVNGELASSDLMLWRDGKSTVVFRGDVSYALADDGRIAIVRLNCPPGQGVHLCPGGTRWELYLLEGSGFIPRLIAKRDVFGGAGGVGGPPAFAGNKIVWARVSTATVKVTSVDIIDAQTGDTRTVTEEDCAWIGSTVREVVFSCPDSVLRVHPVAGLDGVTWSNEAGSRYFVANPHAIIGHHVDRGLSWVIRTVPD